MPIFLPQYPIGLVVLEQPLFVLEPGIEKLLKRVV